jgi:hypothetical protein
VAKSDYSFRRVHEVTGIDMKRRLEVSWPLPEGIDTRDDWDILYCCNVYSGQVAMLGRSVISQAVPTFQDNGNYSYATKIDGGETNEVWCTSEEAFREFYRLLTTP